MSGQCVWVVTIGGLTELDSTRKLSPANELAAMFELGKVLECKCNTYQHDCPLFSSQYMLMEDGLLVQLLLTLMNLNSFKVTEEKEC